MVSYRKTTVLNPVFLNPAQETCKFVIDTRIAALQADKASLHNKVEVSVDPHLSCIDAVCFLRRVCSKV